MYMRLFREKIWGLESGWKEINRMQGRLCKKLLRMTRFTANGVLKLEMGRCIVFGCVIMVQNFTGGKGRIGKRVL
jgi:hypothetical protein